MPLAPRLSPRHLVWALFVIVIWGVNFVAIKIATLEIPPMTLAALRLTLTVLPAVFFIRRPAIALPQLALYGICLYGGQFGFLFVAIHLGASPGLASVILQIHVFLTMALAAVWLRDQPRGYQWLGATIAFIGVGSIALHTGGDMTSISLLCLLGAASAWALGNILTRQFGRVNPLALVIWGNVFAAPALILLALGFEGPALMLRSVHQVHWPSLAALAYTTYLSGILGYGIWSWLLARYQSGAIVPMTLLVPVVGMTAAALILHEQLQPWKLFAALLVMTGLVINSFGDRIWRSLTQRSR